MYDRMEKPKNRSSLRLKAGRCYYGCRRRLLWLTMRRSFARQIETHALPYRCFSHETPLLRNLKNVDMWMQHNKITNLKLAAERVSGILLRPGEVFSYWYLIGKPTKRKGRKEGMVLVGGTVQPGIGGGNMISSEICCPKNSSQKMTRS